MEISGEFRLGNLVTEAQHPRDANLSEVAGKDIAAGLAQLFDIDKDVVETFGSWAASGAAERIGTILSEQLAAGGKVFFTGCGATGRLSIQLAALWRDHWKQAAIRGEMPAATAADLQNRAWSVMAGGDYALIKSVEGFEDYSGFGAKQIQDLGVSRGDVVFAITEGGETSFVIGTAWKALENGAKVFFVYNNPDDVLADAVSRSREILQEPGIEKINLTTGPMAITGSTRMQATSIQLCVMITILEVAIAHFKARAGKFADHAIPLAEIVRQFREGLEEVHRTLESESVRQQVARLVAQEEKVYLARARNNYFADRLAIDVLTDTTERSPTFCIPSFKKYDDHHSSESWSFLFLPHQETEDAWRALLQRDLLPVEWDSHTIRSLVDEADVNRQHEIMRTIGREETLKFRIGLDGLPFRPIRRGDSACAVLTEDELPELMDAGGFYRQQIERADAAGGTTAIVLFGRTTALNEAQRFLDGWEVPVLRILVPLPENRMPLDGPTRIAAKMLLNALSTITMVRLGRVVGNVMIWVVPSNRKLVDRAIRYIQRFEKMGYEEACHLLHRTLQYLSPRINAGEEYPSAVALSIMVSRKQCTFEEAEEILDKQGSDPLAKSPQPKNGPAEHGAQEAGFAP